MLGFNDLQTNYYLKTLITRRGNRAKNPRIQNCGSLFEACFLNIEFENLNYVFNRNNMVISMACCNLGKL